MRFTLLGRRFKFEWVPKSKRRDHFGCCTDPALSCPKIIVEDGHNDVTTLATILHEMRHFENYEMYDEDYVDRVTMDEARILIRLGWRRVKPE